MTNSQFRSRLLRFFLLGCFAVSFTVQGSESRCNFQTPSEVSYVVDFGSVEGLSLFFQQIPTMYFEDLESFSGKAGKRERIETYFDDDDFSLLNAGLEVVHILDENLPNYRLDRERIKYSYRGLFDTRTKVYEVKNYAKKVSGLDKHELFRRIKRAERNSFIADLENDLKSTHGKIHSVLRVEHSEIVFMLSHYGISYAELALDKFHISSFGIPNTSVLFKLNVYPQAKTELKSEEYENLKTRFCQIEEHLEQNFSSLRSTNSWGYQNYNEIANLILPSRRFFSENPMLIKVGQILVLTFIGFLFFYLVLGRFERGRALKYTVFQHKKR